MSKELEAFKNIIKLCEEYHLKFANTKPTKVYGYPIENIEKALIALEIIKEKSVSVGILQMSPNLDVYNNRIIEHPNVVKTKKLTQEEFDLLKEVLGNE